MAPARILALVICMSALLGVGLEVRQLLVGGASLPSALWNVAGYFTILTNAFLAIAFGGVAAANGKVSRPRLIAGLAASIGLVGVVFAILLEGARSLHGLGALADFLLHKLNPILTVLFWLMFVRKGALRWSDPLLWALYPLAYFVYGLWRGMSEGHYAYPFINVARIGWVKVGANAAVIAAGFVAAGLAMVAVDRLASGKR